MFLERPREAMPKAMRLHAVVEKVPPGKWGGESSPGVEKRLQVACEDGGIEDQCSSPKVVDKRLHVEKRLFSGQLQGNVQLFHLLVE